MRTHHRMMPTRYLLGAACAPLAISLVLVAPQAGLASHQATKAGGAAYRQVNLVSNVPGMAKVTDPNLVNAWGAS